MLGRCCPSLYFWRCLLDIGIWNDHDFYKMPAIAGFVTALVVAFLMNPKVSFHEKLNVAARGMADENVMIMCLVFVMAGAFSGSVSAAGGADSTVNFALSILPSNIVVVGIFLIGCFISTSMRYLGWHHYRFIAHCHSGCGKNQPAGCPVHRCGRLWRDVRRQSVDDFGYDDRSDPYAGLRYEGQVPRKY